MPLRTGRLASPEEVEEFRQDFQNAHEELFAIRDSDSPVEIVSWRAHARCSLRDVDLVGARCARRPCPRYSPPDRCTSRGRDVVDVRVQPRRGPCAGAAHPRAR